MPRTACCCLAIQVSQSLQQHHTWAVQNQELVAFWGVACQADHSCDHRSVTALRALAMSKVQRCWLQPASIADPESGTMEPNSV